MRLFLCGHGYLGQAIARDFRAAGWQVDTASRSAGEADHACDLASFDSVSALARSVRGPDFIIHCAASGRGGPDAYRAVYLAGATHLIDAFHGVPMLFTSSTSVYGQTDGSVVTEESPADPDRETGQILRATEKLVLDHEGYVFRLAGIYGPGRSAILKKFLAGDATLDEDGSRHLNQIHRDDAARAVLHAATGACTPGIWNLADSTQLTQLDCYRALAAKFDRPLPPSAPRDLNRKRGWTHKQVSSQKLRSSGWLPRYPSFLDAVDQIAPTL